MVEAQFMILDVVNWLRAGAQEGIEGNDDCYGSAAGRC